MHMAELSQNNLGSHPVVEQYIQNAQLMSEKKIYHLPMPWSEIPVEVYREGWYPLETHEGNFDATLLRITQNGSDVPFRGGEYRIIANKRRTLSQKMDPEHPPLVFIDTTPIFAKEMSFPEYQQWMAAARKRVAEYAGQAMIIQTRASDIHDGPIRFSEVGQQDIREEQWYARAFTIMKAYPGATIHDAFQALAHAGDRPFMADYGLPFTAVSVYFYPGVDINDIHQQVIDHRGFKSARGAGTESMFRPFTGENGRENLAAANPEDIRRIAGTATANRPEHIMVGNDEYDVETLASYPIIRNGLEYDVKLIKSSKKGQTGFRTFRVISRGGPAHAHVRIDSICTNGVQGGDTHCDCRAQIENEMDRGRTDPILTISIRDDEGRNHGEGRKGATLYLQRKLKRNMDLEMGNARAAQLFYDAIGEPVDAREYGDTKAVLKYLCLTHISKLVTNNQAKIDAIREVAQIDEIVTAETDNMSPEAALTIREKAAGVIHNVRYDYGKKNGSGKGKPQEVVLFGQADQTDPNRE